MRFIRAVSSAVCGALVLALSVPQTIDNASDQHAVSSSSDDESTCAIRQIEQKTGTSDSISAAAASLRVYYDSAQTLSLSTQVSQVMAGPTTVDRRMASEMVWKSQASLTRQVGVQITRLIAINQISWDDYETLLKIVEAEATGGDIKSKMLIAGVVMNRVKDSRFPDTITEVVYDRSSDGAAQFSPTMDGRINSVVVTEETKEAVNRVLSGEDETQGALFFVARSTASAAALQWFDSNLEVLFAYGGHDFFRFYEDDPEAEGTVMEQTEGTT